MLKDDKQEIIEAFKKGDNGAQSMRVVGRGTLVMSPRAARDSQKYKDLVSRAESIIGRTRET